MAENNDQDKDPLQRQGAIPKRRTQSTDQSQEDQSRVGQFGPVELWDIEAKGLTTFQLNLLNTEVIRSVEFGQQLGSGGYGAVYKVVANYKSETTYEWVRAEFACKVMHIRQNNSTAINKTRKEGIILGALRHNNICNVIEGIPLPQIDEGHLSTPVICLFLELCHGSLMDLVKESIASGVEGQNWSFTDQLNRRWLTDVANGLAYIHGQGVAHNDIKEENILYILGNPNEDTFEGRFLGSTFKLADFGVSFRGTGALLRSCLRDDLADLFNVIYQTAVPGPTNRYNDEKSRIDWIRGHTPDRYEGLSPQMDALIRRRTAPNKIRTVEPLLNHEFLQDQ